MNVYVLKVMTIFVINPNLSTDYAISFTKPIASSTPLRYNYVRI